MKEIDIFTILNIFIDNAIEEVVHHDRGFIEIYMTKTHKKTIFRIENSIEGGKSAPKPMNTHKGLEIVKKIVSAYPNVDIQTSVKLDVFKQLLEVKND